MKPRHFIVPALVAAALGFVGPAVPATNLAKYPFEIHIRPVENGYIVRLIDAGYTGAPALPIAPTELMAPDASTVNAVVKAWLDALKAAP